MLPPRSITTILRMTEIILNEAQAVAVWQSPMSVEERTSRDMKLHKLQGTREAQGKLLFELYQNCEFRGDDGGQSWSEFLKQVDEELTLSKATRLIRWYLLSDAAKAEGIELLPMPSHLDHWGLLFDRSRQSGSNSWMPYSTDAVRPALQAWKTVVQRVGDGENLNKALCERVAREADNKRQLSAAQINQINAVSNSSRFSSNPPAASSERIVDIPAPPKPIIDLEHDIPDAVAFNEDNDDADLRGDVTAFTRHLTQVIESTRSLHGWLRGIATTKGTEYLLTLAETNVGMLSCNDYVARLKDWMGTVQEIVQLTDPRNADGPTGKRIDFTTIDV